MLENIPKAIIWLIKNINAGILLTLTIFGILFLSKIIAYWFIIAILFDVWIFKKIFKELKSHQ